MVNHRIIRDTALLCSVWMQLTFGTSDGKARFLNQSLTQVMERNTIVNANHSQYLKPASLHNKPAPDDASAFLRQGSMINGNLVQSGIYSMLSEDVFFGTGHVDLLYENSTSDGSVFLDRVAVKIINIWNF